MDEKGGFLVVPSAPSLCEASKNPALWKAHLDADYAVVDSGYLRMLLFFAGRLTLPRISGYQLMEMVLKNADVDAVPFRQRNLMWVVPNEEEGTRIGRLLEASGFDSSRQEYYLAPHYRSEQDFQDQALKAAVVAAKPDWIILCIGGGRQEKLGAFLRSECGRRPGIMATGAAVSFFSGGQAPISRLGDRLFLGWLIRIIYNPGCYLPRYLRAVSLPFALWRLRRMVVPVHAS